MKNKISSILSLALAIPATPTFATESTDNALFKGSNPLDEAMGKPIYVNPETGKVAAFLLACVPRKESQSTPTEGAGIIIWPVKNWSPAKQSKTP